MNPLIQACRQPGGPLRPTFCNIPPWGQWFIYLAGLLSLGIMAYGLYRHRQLWLAGQPAVPARHLGQTRRRVGLFLRYVLGQQALLARPLPGLFHTAIFWGFVLLLLGTVLATLDWDVWRLVLGRRLLGGGFYQLYEFVLDTAGFLFILALLVAMWRRYVVAPHYVLGAWDFVLWSLLFINITGFLLEGLRLAMAPAAWGGYSWLGQGIANTLFSPSPEFVRDTAPRLHLWMWLVHGVAAVVFIAAIPFTNAVHMVTTAINTMLKSLEAVPVGAALQPIDIEEAQFFGVGRLSEFTWKQRLGVDACTRCGRCETVCPAYLSGTPLNPKEIIVGLSNRLREELDAFPAASLVRPVQESRATAADASSDELIVGEGRLIAPAALWACTTCLHCVTVCPAFIEIVDDIVDLRRYLTLSEGSVPATAGQTMRNMGTTGNPWGYAPEDRLKWAEGLEVPVAQAGRRYELLYWVGCSASYDRRNQRLARAMVKLLRAAGVDFAVMAQERCHAESARRMGDEYLYQTAAEENVAHLNGYEFERVVCHCPHCFNTLRHEYPQFGGHYQVVHHSQLLRELIQAGRLQVERSADMRVAFHDSCYLGRYNGEFEAPRAVLAAAGAEVVEMPRSRQEGLCCGGGGGRMWFEQETQERAVEVIRMEEALATRPDVVGVACPFCLTMLASGAASMGEEGVEVLDIAEVLARQVR